MVDYTVPVFARMGRHRKAMPCAIPDSLVAAIRWDYEDGLMRLADVQAKYKGQVSASYVAAICYRKARPDVKARRDVKRNVA